METGSLTAVGTGIQLVGHLTLVAKASIEQADQVLFAVADPVTAKWLGTLKGTAAALPDNCDMSYDDYPLPKPRLCNLLSTFVTKVITETI